MNDLKKQDERSNGDRFIEWLNYTTRTSYAFLGLAGEAPDLVYSDGKHKLFVEVTAAYYDDSHAKMLWSGAVDHNAAVAPWVGLNPDVSLATCVESRILRKSQNTYGKQCVLLVVVRPGITTAEALADLIEKKELRSREFPFAGVYVAGVFPIPNTLTADYQVLVIKPVSLCR